MLILPFNKAIFKKVIYINICEMFSCTLNYVQETFYFSNVYEYCSF